MTAFLRAVIRLEPVTHDPSPPDPIYAYSTVAVFVETPVAPETAYK